MIQSILYGNGINRLTRGMPSWDQLIKELSDVELDENIPNPLKYEAILMKKPYRGPAQRLITSNGFGLMTSNMKRIYAAGELTEKILKKKIAKRLSSFETNSIYDSISQLSVTHFITTNYDNSLFRSLGEGSLNKRFREEQIYSIRRNYVINSLRDKHQYYWPIHGNIDSPASIMLGFDQYCGSLAKIEQYVKGGYDLHSGKDKVESINKRLKQGIDEIISWVDLFFVSDIHIIGLSLGYEETDLWWILNKRRRIKQSDPDLVRNKIYYYPVEAVHDDIQQLLGSFDVDVLALDDRALSLQFPTRYHTQIEAIKQHIR